MELQYQIQPLPICGGYNVQRFVQWGPEDAANFYILQAENTKSQTAMYPTMGRKHIFAEGSNQLVFNSEPRFIFKSVNYFYAVVGNTVIRVSKNYQQLDITGTSFLATGGKIFFTYLIVNTITFACFIDSQKIYIYQEDSGTLQTVTDPNAPGNVTVDGELTKPGYIATFGNRIVVSVAESSQFYLSAINLEGGSFDPATCFTTDGNAVFAQENGIIRQLATLKNQLYIFTDYTTGIWSNIPATFPGTGVIFPWKKNTSYDWNFGMADDVSLDWGFGMMVWLAQNEEGLLQVMASGGGEPQRISTKAIDVLFQKYSNAFPSGGPFLSSNSNGFLYQYENTIFYRLSAGNYNDYGILDIQQSANSIEYDFETKSWHRCIEANGERSRVQQHVFFNNKHLVTVDDQRTVYELNGSFYENELENPDAEFPDDPDFYISYPMRYERVTPIIAEPDQGEFETEFVQIDMVFGNSDINYYEGGFANAVYLVDEQQEDGEDVYLIDDESDEGDPTYLIAEEGNQPTLEEKIYNKIFKPHVELYFSDNGGITYSPADVREFSQQGEYQWRMRWYQLGCSRNRVYKLIAVSPVPIVILSGYMNVRRVGTHGN